MTQSSIRDNHSRGTAGDFISSQTKPGADLSFVSAYFNYFAHAKLKNVLNQIAHLRFLFGEPKFLQKIDPNKTNSKAFKITDDELTIPIEDRLQQKAIARECCDWIREKVEIRSLVEP
ncbi:MAG: ATP-dependent helicase, partial [Bacteroidota bacterium]